jgi:hypothetical protein
VPSLRGESFHKALFESMDLLAKAEMVGKMLRRLERAINAEHTSIESVERRADEERRLCATDGAESKTATRLMGSRYSLAPWSL